MLDRPDRVLLAAALLVLAGPILGAQDQAPQGPQVTVSAGWTFQTEDQAGTDAPWTTKETAFAGLTARWGSALELSGRVASDFTGTPLTADGVLDQLALTWTANGFTILTVGKQRLSWGTARVFSAIDSLEPPLDPVDPQAKPRGVTGVKAELIPLDWLSVWVLVLPAPRLDDALGALRVDFLWDEADLSMGAVRSVARPVTGFGPTSGDQDRREAPAVFVNFARFFERFGVYGEAQYRQGRNRDWFLAPGLDGAPWTLRALDEAAPWTLRATGGLQVEIPVWLNGTARWLTEYHYNGEGFTAPEAQEFSRAWDRTKALPPVTAFGGSQGLSVGAFRQHYAFTGVSGVPLARRFTAGASALAGLDGGLLVLTGSLTWEVSPSLNVWAGWDRFDRWGPGTEVSELLFLPSRNRVSLNVSAWY